MKVVCDFCKTEYSLNKYPTTPVRCAVCGYTWNVPRPARRGAWMIILAAVTALMAAGVFAFAAVSKHQMDEIKNNPLIAVVQRADVITDDDGVSHFVVGGVVKNRSDQIYGVPDLIIVTMDANDNVIAHQKFMPSATLLDPGASVSFSHTLSTSTAGVNKIDARLEPHGEIK